MNTRPDYKLSVFLIVSAFTLTGCHGNQLTARLVPAFINYSGHSGTVIPRTEWTISSAHFSGVKLAVLSANLGPSDVSCSGSYIEIKDGRALAPRLDKICRFSRTIVYKSTGQYITIIYHQASFQRNDDFKLKYWVYDKSICKGGYKPASSSFSYILFTNNPDSETNDASDLDCEWLMDTEDSSTKVTLRAQTSGFRRTTSSCSTYYFEAFDGTDYGARSLQRWCGSNGPSLNSTGRYMYIRFHSGNINYYIKFQLRYSAISDGKISTRTAIIAGAVIGSMVTAGVIITACCIMYCRRADKEHQAALAARQSQDSLNTDNADDGFPRSSQSSPTTNRSDRTPRPVPSAPSLTANVNVNIYAISMNERSRRASIRSVSSSLSSLSLPNTRAPPPAYESVVNNDTDLPPSYTDAVEQQLAIDSSNQTTRYIPSGSDEHQYVSNAREDNSSNRNTDSITGSVYI